LNPLASLIILTKNEEANIGRCLDGVFSQKVDFPFEVIIVDSGSTDRTLEIARRYDVTLLEIKPEEFDHGRTRQFGAEHAAGEFVVTIVADAYPVDDSWLANLLAPFREDENIVGVYGGQIPRDDCDPFFAWRLSQWITGTEKPREHFFPSPDEIERLSPEEKRFELNFDDINSARRATVLREFPFPEAEYAEDLVWARNVLAAGKKLVYCPSATVRHSHHRTLAYTFKKRFLDQRFHMRNIGLALYPSLTAAARALPRETRNYLAVALRAKGALRKLKWSILAPFFALAEITGSYLGIMSARNMEECRSNIEKQIKRKADTIAIKYSHSAIRHPKA